MPSPAPFTARVPKLFRKTITFDGEAGSGATGTVAIATVTGAVDIDRMCVRCTTSLTSSGGTLALGTSDNTGGLVEQTTASEIDAGDFWQDSTPEAGVSPTITAQVVDGNLILTVGTADVTAGVLEFLIYWLPMSSDGQLA